MEIEIKNKSDLDNFIKSSSTNPSQPTKKHSREFAYFYTLPAGIRRIIHVILAYHYDAILREINQEAPDQIDWWTEFMEESNLATFLNEIENEQ